MNWDLGDSIVLNKQRGRDGFILAEAIMTLWICTLFICMFGSIQAQQRRQEARLLAKAELSSQLLSKSNLVLGQTPEQRSKTKLIEVKNGEQKIRLEIIR